MCVCGKTVTEMAQVPQSRSEASSPALDEQSTHVFENLAKKLHRLESKLGEHDPLTSY